MVVHRRRSRVPRLPVLAGIAAVVFAALAAFLVLQYADRVSLARERASRIFVEATTDAVEQIDFLLDDAVVLARVAPNVRGIGDPVTGDGRDNAALDFLIAAVQSMPSIYAAYYGLDNGDFLEIIATHGDPATVAALSAPAGTAIVRRTVTSGATAADRTQSWVYLDAAGTVLAHKEEAHASFDPRQTMWYRRIEKTDDDAKLSLPYQFSSIPVLGMTVVKSLPAHHGVFGIDFTLTGLSQFVGKLHISENGAVYLFDTSLRLLAAPPDGPNGVPSDQLLSDMRPLRRPVLQALAELSTSADSGHVNAVRVAASDYLASISPWHGSFGADINIGVAAPSSDFSASGELTQLLVAIAVVCALSAVAGAIALAAPLWRERRA